jgi:hypothetical protein
MTTRPTAFTSHSAASLDNTEVFAFLHYTLYGFFPVELHVKVLSWFGEAHFLLSEHISGQVNNRHWSEELNTTLSIPFLNPASMFPTMTIGPERHRKKGIKQRFNPGTFLGPV